MVNAEITEKVVATTVVVKAMETKDVVAIVTIVVAIVTIVATEETVVTRNLTQGRSTKILRKGLSVQDVRKLIQIAITSNSTNVIQTFSRKSSLLRKHLGSLKSICSHRVTATSRNCLIQQPKTSKKTSSDAF